MNARYVLSETPHALGEHFGILVTDNFPARYNMAPSQPVPVILTDQGKRKYEIVRWGFVPAWDREGRFLKKATVNIRSETAHEKPMFRAAWRRRRCLFPLNGFYEWRAEGKVKQPYFIARSSAAPLFALAGLYEDWLGADGSELRSAAFLTRESAGMIRQLHTRTPVVVAPQDYDLWLRSDETDHASACAVVTRPAQDFVFWAVDRKVGSWKASGSALIAPIEGGELRCGGAQEPQRTQLF